MKDLSLFHCLSNAVRSNLLLLGVLYANVEDPWVKDNSSKLTFSPANDTVFLLWQVKLFLSPISSVSLRRNLYCSLFLNGEYKDTHLYASLQVKIIGEKDFRCYWMIWTACMWAGAGSYAIIFPFKKMAPIYLGLGIRLFPFYAFWCFPLYSISYQRKNISDPVSPAVFICMSYFLNSHYPFFSSCLEWEVQSDQLVKCLLSLVA